jgi:hypothetical protein
MNLNAQEHFQVDTSDDSKSCEIGLITENDLMIYPAGILPYLTNPYDVDLLNPEFDKGYTAALFLNLSYRYNQNKNKFDMVLSSQLYTGNTGQAPEVIGPDLVKKNKVYPTLLHHIFFTEENRLRFLLEKAIQSKLKIEDQFFKVGVNMIHLNNQKIIPGGITSVQKLYHETFDQPGQPQYQYYAGDQTNKFQFSADCRLGMINPINSKLSYNIGAGASIGTVSGLNHFFQDALLKLKLPVSKKKPKYFIFEVGERSIFHPRGIEFSPGYQIGYEGKKVKITNSAFYRFGKSHKEYVQFDQNLRPITSLAIFIKL